MKHYVSNLDRTCAGRIALLRHGALRNDDGGD
jgi:hypothetical protein